MASTRELDSFVTKFKHLLHNGFEATLSMESKMGKAFVILKAGLDPVSTPKRTYVSQFSPSSQLSGIPSRYRSPSYRRRQERRRIAREDSNHIAEEANNVVDSPEYPTEKVADSQAEMFVSKAQYEVKINAQEDVKIYDMMEALDVNFSGGLGDRNVDLTCSRNMYVHQIGEKTCTTKNEDGFREVTFKILVDDDEIAIDVIENWQKPGQFDDLAFRNALSDKRQVKIQEVKKL